MSLQQLHYRELHCHRLGKVLEKVLTSLAVRLGEWVVIEILIDGRLLSTQVVPTDPASPFVPDLHTAKKIALARAIEAGEVRIGQALQVGFRVQSK